MLLAINATISPFFPLRYIRNILRVCCVEEEEEVLVLVGYYMKRVDEKVENTVMLLLLVTFEQILTERKSWVTLNGFLYIFG